MPVSYRVGEDQPFTYSFKTIDLCTHAEFHLYKPLPEANTITSPLYYDVETPCARRNDRSVMVLGTVTDRLGASVDMCNSGSCPVVALAILPDIEASSLFVDTKSLLRKNLITNTKAVEDVTLAMRVYHRQLRQREEVSKISNISKDVELLDSVISVIANVTADTLAFNTLQTPRNQGVWPMPAPARAHTHMHIHLRAHDGLVMKSAACI